MSRISEAMRANVLFQYFDCNWHVDMVTNHLDLSMLEVIGIIIDELDRRGALPDLNVHELELFKPEPKRRERAA